MNLARALRRLALPAFIAAAIPLLPGCERSIIRKEERPFMNFAEQNWRKLSPKQKADYYEMVEKQKDRARKDREKGERRQEWK
jgi:hypothetical protein